METNEVIEKLKYYTKELPRDAIKEAINKKEEITPKLLEMLEYAIKNAEKIVKGEDEFFGYTYAIFLLAEFREQKAFPYIIELLNMDEEIVDYIIGEDYPDYLPRILASTYNGDDKALFSIIENDDADEIIRSCVLQVYGILYIYEEKDKNFLVEYIKRLLQYEDILKDNSFFYTEIAFLSKDLRLVELDGIIDKTYKFLENEEIQEIKDVFADENYKINRNIYPFNKFYEYINDTIQILEQWQCFRCLENEEYSKSKEFKLCRDIITKRYDSMQYNFSIGRNELCTCGSGKKYKKCCMLENTVEQIEQLNLIDGFVCRGEWYINRKEYVKAINELRIAYVMLQDICKQNYIRTISRYEQKYKGYKNFSDWLQNYIKILEISDRKSDLYVLIELCNEIEETFNLEKETEKNYKELIIKTKENIELRIRD